MLADLGIALAPPEQKPQHLFGFVRGHPFHADGKQLRTSRLVYRKDGCVLTRSGSQYELGDPHPDYEAEYPEARQRLLASLPRQPEAALAGNELLQTFVGAEI